MTDVLDTAGSTAARQRWHPSSGSPPGLTNDPDQPHAVQLLPDERRRGWHPSAGGPKRRDDREHDARVRRRADLEPAREHGGGRSGPRLRNARAGQPQRRALLLIIAAVIALAVLAGRLVQIQVLDRETYVSLGDRQGTAQWELESVRGAILDRNLSLLAVSDHLPTVWADPRLVTDPAGTATALAAVLDIDTAVVAERLASDRHFVYVARQVSPSAGRAALELDLPGISVRGEYSRLRPNGDEFARGVLGIVDIDENPLGGAEKQFADLLDGTDGREVARIAQGGMPLPIGVQVFEPANNGDDLVLTLHTQTQWVAEQTLVEAVEETGARGGMVVVMQVATGDVLALAGVVRDLDTGDVTSTAYNPAYTDTFEPGSVAKTFTLAAVLEAGLTTPDEVHRTPVRYTFADRVFVEPYSRVDREMTTREILTYSSNIGTIQLAERLGAEDLQRQLRAFGFGRLTGGGQTVALPGESRGILLPANAWHGTDLATIGFGQGIAVTAVQLAAAYNAIANDGVYVTPRLVLGSVGSEGTLRRADPAATDRILSPSTAGIVSSMLTDVVNEGTGKRAAIPGYAVAGKTGTAQKPSADGGYSDAAYTSSFAGFLPADRPELTVVVVLDEPDEYRAGIVAAPVFAEVAEYALRVLQVAPDA